MKLGQKVLGKKLFGLMMKQTFYGHFVAGEDHERIKPTIGRMQRCDLGIFDQEIFNQERILPEAFVLTY